MEEEARLREIEKRLNTVENEQALYKQSTEFSKEKYTALEKRIDTIQAGVNRLIWTGGGLIIVAIGNFIIKGGLTHAGV